ncbi:hypothetical protein Kisp02_03580 [Kineosporia sp. NBRC 101731]|nr:hypothetical protein Kisp02_03580 [Kineosporia sp. NBRC 101731]
MGTAIRVIRLDGTAATSDSRAGWICVRAGASLTHEGESLGPAVTPSVAVAHIGGARVGLESGAAFCHPGDIRPDPGAGHHPWVAYRLLAVKVFAGRPCPVGPPDVPSVKCGVFYGEVAPITVEAEQNRLCSAA